MWKRRVEIVVFQMKGETDDSGKKQDAILTT